MKGFFSPAIEGRCARLARKAPRGGWVATLALAGAAAAACSDENGPSGPSDPIPPEILIRQPADNTTVFAADGRPQFVIDLSDRGSGVFDSSIDATLDGRSVSDAFRNGFDEADGEIRLKSPIILPDGGRLIVVTVSDHRGNEARAQSRFVVTSIAPPPPPGAAARVP